VAINIAGDTYSVSEPGGITHYRVKLRVRTGGPKPVDTFFRSSTHDGMSDLPAFRRQGFLAFTPSARV
jgi:hypothetical protein